MYTLPSAEEKALWQELAQKAGMPLTKLIIEIVDNALADDAELKPREEISKEISALRKEVKELKDELKLKTIVLDKYEAELKRYRNAASLATTSKAKESTTESWLKRGGWGE
jgi:hypothetical protein